MFNNRVVFKADYSVQGFHGAYIWRALKAHKLVIS